MVYRVLQVVDRDPDLNSENVVEKVEKAFFKKRAEVRNKAENNDDEASMQYSLYRNAHESWEENGFAPDHQLSTGCIFDIEYHKTMLHKSF